MDYFPCHGCHKSKPETEFYRDRSRARKWVVRCKECYSAKQKQDRIDKPQRRYYEAKSNAIRRGPVWRVTFEQYVLLFWQATCFFCGEPSNGGIDRMMNEPFYSMANTVACCGRCNSMKSDMTYHEFLDRGVKIINRLRPREDSLQP